jgi:Raf kinase inhibitor-like YbhB/YbcL family protein
MVSSRFRNIIASLGLLAAFGQCLPASAAGTPKQDAFVITSKDFQDNAIWPNRFGFNGKAGDGTACGGENVSPALAWNHAPAGTKSFALLMFDPDGRGGQGVSHWIAYDLPGNVISVATGEMSRPGPKFVGGSNQRNLGIFMGPCPPKGDPWHHYTIQLFALDVAPGSLPAGLTRDGFFEKVTGHVLAETSIIGRYTR